MPVTALDKKTALLIVDLQKGLLGIVPPATFNALIERNRALADAFRAQQLPVVLITAAGVAPGRTEHPSRFTMTPGFADVVDELNQQASDILVTKYTWGAFVNTNLETILKSLGVTQVVVTGVATSIGVESTARQAFEAGLNVTVAIDAVADLRPEAHDNSIALIFPRLGETDTSDAIIALLNKHG